MADVWRGRAAISPTPVWTVLLFKPAENRLRHRVHGLRGPRVRDRGQALLAVDFRYYDQAAAQAPACEVLRAAQTSWPRSPRRSPHLGLRRLGFEAEFVPFAQVERWRAKFARSNLCRSAMWTGSAG